MNIDNLLMNGDVLNVVPIEYNIFCRMPPPSVLKPFVDRLFLVIVAICHLSQQLYKYKSFIPPEAFSIQQDLIVSLRTSPYYG